MDLPFATSTFTLSALERRSDIYSDRPPNVMGGQLMTGGKFFLFTPVGPM